MSDAPQRADESRPPPVGLLWRLLGELQWGLLGELLGGNRGYGHDVVRVEGMTHTEQEAEESQREGTEHDPRNVARRAALTIKWYFAE
ncbi:MAG: hypothetical protein Q8K82_05905 [Gemmatimonadaceae bacterium]|nr:hypothetical protein [Gemmatimonadaceae bacterium]